jgi:hypothetical protein
MEITRHEVLEELKRKFYEPQQLKTDIDNFIENIEMIVFRI